MSRNDTLIPEDNSIPTSNTALPQIPNTSISTPTGTGSSTGTFTPTPPVYIDNQGWLETYYQDTITGWAASGATPSDVDVYVDGKFFAKVTPSITRLDVANSLNSNLKNFGFSYVIPEKGGNKDIGNHEIKVLFSGTQQQLNNSPIFYEIKDKGGNGTIIPPVVIPEPEPPVVIIPEPQPQPTNPPTPNDKLNKAGIFISKNYKPIVIGLGVIAALLIVRKLFKTNE